MELYKYVTCCILMLISHNIIINDSYKHISGYGKYVNLTCLLPPTDHADKVVIFKTNENSSFHHTLNVTNAGPEVPCYCGDADKEYTFFLTNFSTGENEGKYRCVFYLDNNETHRHAIDLRVIPKVVTYSYLGDDGTVYYGCNRTKTKEEKSVKLYAKVGSSKVESNSRGISFNSTKNSFVLSVASNKTSEKVVCGLSYQGRTEERIIKYVAKN
ncbi:SWPV1-292 [Shearwaterpox virus]|uniref:SWPV1-292 n=1 Tax=Shearwaterpox virus TaxID=1974596 RepID=A0A1V0S893_CNPV|nr:SWPV1-292 [Shearwaterpox virus]